MARAWRTKPASRGAERAGRGIAVLAAVVLVAGAGASPAAAAPGELDPSFGSGGQVTTDFGGTDDRARGLALQPDGKILTVGYMAGRDHSRFTVARHGPDGILDTGFGEGGRAVVPFEGTAEGAAVAVDGEGRVVAAGYAQVGETFDFALARLLPDGRLDPSFGVGGIVTNDLTGRADMAFALALGGDGTIVVAGCTRCLKNSSHFAVARYLPDGSLDQALAGRGWVETDFDKQADEATSVVLQRDGRIVVAGYAAALEPRGIGPGSRNVQFGLARYLPDGKLDPGFGTNGRVMTDFAENNDAAAALVVQPDGRLVAAGLAYIDGSWDFALARYLADGKLDPAFGRGGKVSTDFAPARMPAANADGSYARGDAANAVAVAADGSIIAAGVDRNQASDDFALTRYGPTGALDPTFGDKGMVRTDFHGSEDSANGVAIAPDGTIVVAGIANRGGNDDFGLARYRGGLAAGVPVPG